MHGSSAPSAASIVVLGPRPAGRQRSFPSPEVSTVVSLRIRSRSLALAAVVLACGPAAALAASGGGAAADPAVVVGGARDAGGAGVPAPTPTPATRDAARRPRAGGGASPRQRPLARGARGRAVSHLQRLLTRAGLPTPVVGSFGPQTERHVRAFQRRARLRADGVVTARVLAVLARAAASRATPARPTPPAPPAPTPGATAAEPIAPATLLADGTASPPAGAPAEVAAVIAAGNAIASTPYRWGGGHRTWDDSGYDCSGSVSYALHGGGLIDASSDSSGLMSYGEPGRGRWITIYSNPDHVYMVVAGLRYDTSGARPSRWQAQMRSAQGFTVRHPAGF